MRSIWEQPEVVRRSREEIVPLACTGAANAPQWLDAETSNALDAKPERNLIPTALEQQTGLIIEALPAFRESPRPLRLNALPPSLRPTSGFARRLAFRAVSPFNPVLPVDILGAYVLLPRI